MKSVRKYNALMQRLQTRYTKNGYVTISIGGKPSKYSRLETMAFLKYLQPARDDTGALLFS